jgi:hypothetical protein
MPEHERQSFRRLNFAGVIHPGILQNIVVDVVCPYMIYPLLQPRIAPLQALLLVALFPLASIIVSWIQSGSQRAQQRLLDPLGIAALYVIACELVSMYMSPGISMANRSALFVALPGLIVLLSRFTRFPLAVYVERYARILVAEHNHQQTEELSNATSLDDHANKSDSGVYQQNMQTITLFWGVGQLVMALLLWLSGIAVLQTLLQDMQPLAIPFIIAVGYLALIVWTVQYSSTHQQGWPTHVTQATDAQ